MSQALLQGIQEKKTRGNGQSCSQGSYSIKKEVFIMMVAKH